MNVSILQPGQDKERAPAAPGVAAGPLFIGIDVGCVSVNCVVVDPQRRIVHEPAYRRHQGRVEACILDLLEDLYDHLGSAAEARLAFTGTHGRSLARRLDAFYEFETISRVLGVLHLVPAVRSIISMGGQESALFQIAHNDTGWELELFNTNGPCASGTGSFIDQQAQRLATAIYSADRQAQAADIDRVLADFIRLGGDSRRPADVACRCTVFTKSDMIHLQNKGERLEDIIHGLHIGNARNFVSTLVANRQLIDPVVFIGGMALNPLQVKALREYFPNLIVPSLCTSAGALGVALQALDHGEGGSLDPVRAQRRLAAAGARELPVAAPLVLRKTVFPEDNRPDPVVIEVPAEVYLGVDIGSTTTKYALIREDGRIVHKAYVHTRGKPIEVTQALLQGVRREWGERLRIRGVATTGSGRNVVGDFLNADLIIDEITAHARGAVEIDPRVDTIFEIGGQDSKYIALADTHPLDFDMNKVCAAGTGSFLHELANKYGINIVDEFQRIALAAKTPVQLAERCTVFMESDLVSYHQQGAAREDLMAGLCYAIVHNYLNRVVGKRTVGQRVMFLGGPSLNKAVVAAFENVLGRGLLVPRHREVLGAYGAALSVRERQRRQGATSSGFRGLDSAIADSMAYTETICRADKDCHNQCKLKIYNFDGRRSIWGGECGRYEHAGRQATAQTDFFAVREAIWHEYLDPVCAHLQGDERLPEVDGRPTVGMQRALYTFQHAVLWATFFDALGLRLVLTPPTCAPITRLGIEAMTAETCFPVKVSHGHVRALAGKTRYLFLPSPVNMPTPRPEESGLYCPMVQSNTHMVRQAVELDDGCVLAPVMHLKWETERLALELDAHLRPRLDIGRRRIRQALRKGLERQAAFEAALYRRGRAILAGLPADRPVVVVTGRPYNLCDQRLNLNLGRNLARLGLAALPMDLVDVRMVDISDFPSMYWGLGAQILRTAKFVRRRPNFFGLHLTNFSCGADSFMEHFYRHIMGRHPYLILELDEHSAVAGVMTRLEAFRHVMHNTLRDRAASDDTHKEVAN